MSNEYLGLAGAVLAALIGALVLLIISRTTAEKIQENYAADKLAEAKRDVFLGLVDHWMDYLMIVNTFGINPQKEYREAVFQATKDLVSSLHKSSFISEPNTKKEVMLFSLNFSRKNLELSKITNDWYELEEQDRCDLNYKLFQILDGLGAEALVLQNLLRTELGINNDPKIDSFLSLKQKEFVSEMEQSLLGTK